MSGGRRCYASDRPPAFFCSPRMALPTPLVLFQPKSVISVMMMTAFIFEQMSCCFECAMEFHCNRKAAGQMTKRKRVSA